MHQRNKERETERMAEVTLYGAWFSPYVKRVETALKLKGVEYKFIDEDLTKKSDDLLLYNPIMKKVPVLVHKGKAIVDSIVILEYIDEVWKGEYSLLPSDSHDRAMSRFWAKFIQEKCVDATWRAFWAKTPEERNKAKEEAEEALKILEKELKGKKFLGGDKIGLVDLASNYIAFWLEILQEETGLQILTEEKFPCLWKWSKRFCDESSVEKFLPDRKKMALGFKMALATGNFYPSLSLIHSGATKE